MCVLIIYIYTSIILSEFLQFWHVRSRRLSIINSILGVGSVHTPPIGLLHGLRRALNRLRVPVSPHATRLPQLLGASRVEVVNSILQRHDRCRYGGLHISNIGKGTEKVQPMTA